jgi:pimeloyl-ACP methyl ester carboxylesterase
MTDWVDQVAGQIKKTIQPGDSLFGFSFGAMVAMVLASRFQFSTLYLASMSPFFRLQLATLPQSWQRSIGTNRVKDFATYDLQRLASTISASTIFFIGELESQKWPLMLESVEMANRLINTSRIVNVPKTGHDLASQNYIRSIAEDLTN